MALTGKGVQSYGFERPNLTEILEDIKSDFNTKFGVGLSTSDDSVAGHLISIFADRENELWKILEALYTSHTLSGAEGIYLNDILSKVGVLRKGRTRATGTAFIEFDSTATTVSIITALGTTFTGTNGKNFTMGSDVIVYNSVGALRVLYSSLINTVYTFTVTDTSDTLDYQFIYDFTAGTFNAAAIEDFFTQLTAFIIQHTTPTNTDRINRASGTGDLLVGFNSSEKLVGIVLPTKMYFDEQITEVFTSVPVAASVIGYFPLEAGQLTTMSPEPSGFISVTNPLSFYSGSEIETDAEYRYRFSLEPLSSSKATRDGIVNAVLGLDDVSAVTIYKNISDDIGASPADPYTFMVVVSGGNASDIVKTIYDTMPIDGATSGTYSQNVATADGKTELIKYTPATTAGYVVRVTYTTKTNSALSTTEQNSIRTAISSLSDTYTIGETVFHDQVLSAVSSVVTFGRITNLGVEIKVLGSDDITYSEGDYTPLFSELPELVATDTAFLQVI